MQLRYIESTANTCEICVTRTSVATVLVQGDKGERTQIVFCKDCESEAGREILRLLDNEGVDHS